MSLDEARDRVERRRGNIASYRAQLAEAEAECAEQERAVAVQRERAQKCLQSVQTLYSMLHVEEEKLRRALEDYYAEATKERGR